MIEYGLTESEYNSRVGTRSSTLKALADSPAECKAAIDGRRKFASKSMEFGTIVHCLLLEGFGVFNQRYAVLPDFQFDAENVTGKREPSTSRATSYYKEKLAEFHAENEFKEIVDGRTFRQARDLLEYIYQQADAIFQTSNIFQHGSTEVSVFVDDPEFGPQKCRLDWWMEVDDMNYVIDIKTARNARTDKFQWDCRDYHYPLQMWHYGRCLGLENGKPTEHYIIAISNDDSGPFVNFVQFDNETMGNAFMQWRELQDDLKRRIAENDWVQSLNVRIG